MPISRGKSTKFNPRMHLRCAADPESASLKTLGPIKLSLYFWWFVLGIVFIWLKVAWDCIYRGLAVASLTAVRGWVCWSRVRREEEGGWPTKVILLGLY